MNEVEVWKSLAQAHEENYNQMLKRVDELVAENKLWQQEANRWRDMYCEYDEMLDTDILDAKEKIANMDAEIEKIKKQMSKGY
jgi:hypothetical protein